MKSTIFLKLGGLYHLFFAITHFFFPKIFKWDTMLGNLPTYENTVMSIHLKILNYDALLFLIIFALIPIFYSKELIETQLGKFVLTSIVSFWVIRIFVVQPIVAGLTSEVSIRMILFFLVALILFLIPWIQYVILDKK